MNWKKIEDQEKESRVGFRFQEENALTLRSSSKEDNLNPNS